MGSISKNINVQFDILESEQICNKGTKELASRKNISFLQKMPCGEYDIIHAGRSMQYVEDWVDIIEQFCLLQPKYIIFAGLLAGEIKTFVTLQNYYGSKIPVRFQNLDEVIGKLEEKGYELIYKTLHISSRLNVDDGELPMYNFPSKYQLKYPCQLLFRKLSK